jgi:uncharacterized protein YwqG
MNKEKIQDILGVDAFNKLEPFLRHSIRLYPTPISEDAILIGQTKIGGKPDLPINISWATEINTIEQKKSLSFIAQINLSDIAPFDKENLLPSSGILYFFYSAEQEIWGFDPKDKNKFKVIYWNGDFLDLKRTDYPNDLPQYSCFKACAVKIKPEFSLPSYEHQIYQSFSDEELEKFWKEIYIDDNINKVLGYADEIQNSMELECELVTNGIYCGDALAYNDPQIKQFELNAEKWLLLLQIDSNEENGMMWGDCGRIYFWIKRCDLLNKQFDKSWFCLQCC